MKYTVFNVSPVNGIRGLFAICACMASLSAASSTTDSTKKFFDSLETALRSDYRLCTNDSAGLSLEKLLSWRRPLDSIQASPGYPDIVRKFTEETGIRPSDARPCEIIGWMRKIEDQIHETTKLLSDERALLLRRTKDSLSLVHELVSLSRSVFDYSGIPFGLSRRNFLVMARQRALPALDKGNRVLRCDSVAFGSLTMKAAFHFSKEDRYWCYELESKTCGFDSLDSGARIMMELIATHLETLVSRPPDHIYRIGHFDIVPGRLSIGRLWDSEDVTAYAGLARTGSKFYAKLIVQSR